MFVHPVPSTLHIILTPVPHSRLLAVTRFTDEKRCSSQGQGLVEQRGVSHSLALLLITLHPDSIPQGSAEPLCTSSSNPGPTQSSE